jgi:molecular chaperone DnaJ
MAKDYYEALGVDKSATPEQIKSAYRKLAKQYHPDLNEGDEQAAQKFKEINEAYQVLGDEKKRQQYDQFGSSAFDGSAGGGFSGGFQGFEGFDGFSDIFESFFGGGGNRGARSYNGPQRGADVRVNLRIEFEEAAFGVRKEIQLSRHEVCDECGGTGAAKGSSRKTCPQCNGSGQVRTQQQTLFGSFMNVTTCPRCGGEGSIVEEPCPKCKGSGNIPNARKIAINIPAGIDDGQVLTMRGEGESGKRNGGYGDLLIYITVKPHKLFVRQGYDLYVDMTVSMTQAALGAEVEIPTLDGTVVRYKISEGTQPSTVFRLKGKGVKHLNRERYGDLYIKAIVEIPKKLTEKQKKALAEFEKEDKTEKNVFTRFKDMFGK